MNLSRSKKLALTTITSFSLQGVTVICGFILPRIILGHYGSTVNGLVNSISQFLGIISLLDLGVGSVVRSSLFKPLANSDYSELSKIYVSASKYFKRIGIIFLGYVAVLIIFYPTIVNSSFDYLFTATLILAMSISLFGQYYFGIVNATLLAAHQKGYIQNTIQIISVILNTTVCVILIMIGCSIQVVKLVSSLIFIIRPLFLNYYVNKHYRINYHATYDEEPIKQKWNGIAQHFAAFVLEGTDNIVLTVLSTLESVSIYSVYNMVLTGVKQLLLSLVGGVSPVMGDMLAKNEKEKLYSFFSFVEWIIHTGVTLIFGCTGILIVPFVSVYTNGINDTNYILPLFGVLITLAHAGHCLRLPYNMIILAAGHYKQTQSNYIIAMLLNIVISISTVKLLGLPGVAIGTLVAMLYQTIWMAWYDSKNIICWPFKKFIKQIIVDIAIAVVASMLTFRIPLLSLTYYSWILLGVEVFTVWFLTSIIINSLLYRDNMSIIVRTIKSKLGRI